MPFLEVQESQPPLRVNSHFVRQKSALQIFHQIDEKSVHTSKK